MYSLNPPAVYIHESVLEDARYRRRVQDVIRALAQPVDPVVYRDTDLPRLIHERGLLAGRHPMGTLAEVHDPILLFNTFRFDNQFEERYQALKQAGCDPGAGIARTLLGAAAFHWANYNLEGDPARADKVCRPCWRIHLQCGCLHRCMYCNLGGLLISNVNIEEYCQHLGRLMDLHPWQTTYLLDDDADPPCLEPEHGILRPLMEYFGARPNRYLIIHTKTSNTAWARGVKHNGHTIGVWSISGDTQSRLLEPRAGTTRERVEAARAAQKAGLTIRYKFKPIIPVRTWREDAANAVRLIFERTKPDIISLCCFMWMDVDELKLRLPVDQLDPAYLKAAEDSRAETKATLTRPFPEWVRAEIYDHYLAEIRKWNADIPVSLSTENFVMWKLFAPKLGMTATNYVCGCGPQCVPGIRKLAEHPFHAAVRHDAGTVPGVYM